MQFTMASRFLRRRWFRFSLRTFLVLVTAICILLGLYIKQKRDQQAAIETIKRWGGSIEFAHQPSPKERLEYQLRALNAQMRGSTPPPIAVSPPPGPEWLRRLLGDYFFAEAVSLTIPYRWKEDIDLDAIMPLKGIKRLSIKDRRLIGRNELSKLARFSNLEELRFYYVPVTDDGLRAISGLVNLRWLTLGHANITDGSLMHLQHLQNLEHLDISNTVVTDAGLAHLSHLKNLKSVDISNTRVSLDGIAGLRQALPGCEIMYTHPEVIDKLR